LDERGNGNCKKKAGGWRYVVERGSRSWGRTIHKEAIGKSHTPGEKKKIKTTNNSSRECEIRRDSKRDSCRLKKILPKSDCPSLKVKRQPVERRARKRAGALSRKVSLYLSFTTKCDWPFAVAEEADYSRTKKNRSSGRRLGKKSRKETSGENTAGSIGER